MALKWETEELEILKKREVIIFSENIKREDLNDSELPTDIHLIEYRIGTTLFCDAVRCYKKVPIFDVYFDKLKLLGGEIISITNGYGKIKPNLYQKEKAK